MKLSQAKEYLLFVQAAAEGKTIEYNIGTHENPLWVEANRDNSEHFLQLDIGLYRIKIEKKFRPWKPEEVPVGALIRGTMYPDTKYLIVGINHDKQLMFGHNATQRLTSELNTYEHSLDLGKTWLPCGVLE